MTPCAESGRTLVEMLATLSIVGLLAWGATRVYNGIVTRVKVQNTAKMIQTLVFERQNSAINSATGGAMNVKGPHSALRVQNGTRGNHEPYFWVETTLKDSDFCEALKESNLIQAEFIEVDKIRNGACTDNSKIAFYFKKDKGGSAYCPSNATNCDQYGDATGCEDGYYLDNGVCSACGEHVATCEDENTPISCESGYLLYGGSCVSSTCTVDSDCTSVCASCEDGMCTNECEIPTPDANQDCGENECIIYDENTQTCKNACTRVEYLESTGTQYIDTGYKLNDASVLEISAQSTDSTQSNNTLLGVGTTGASTDRVQVHFGSTAGHLSVRLDGTLSTNQIVGTNSFIVKIDIPNKKAYYNETEIVSSYTGSIDTADNIALFNRMISGNIVESIYASKANVYYFKIWDSNTLVRDFIPVSSPKGNCMFDRVSQKLFCNQGTGDDFKTNLDE